MSDKRCLVLGVRSQQQTKVIQKTEGVLGKGCQGEYSITSLLHRVGGLFIFYTILDGKILFCRFFFSQTNVFSLTIFSLKMYVN